MKERCSAWAGNKQCKGWKNLTRVVVRTGGGTGPLQLPAQVVVLLCQSCFKRKDSK